MSCGNRSLLRPGLLIGSDLRFWSAALRFAAGMVMRGQFLPGVTSGNGDYAAVWQPVISGADIGRVIALAKGMPASARAISPDIQEPKVSSHVVLRAFLESAVDHLVRSSLPVQSKASAHSIHDRWITALTSKEKKVFSVGDEVRSFATQVAQWKHPIQISSRAPFRLCFRLEEPEEGSRNPDTWIVRYLLQGTHDPSLVLPAADAWNLKREEAPWLKGKTGAVRELFLASLGQAASIYPRIEESLREKAPKECRLDATQAHEFLRERATALEQSGFGVILPAWWTRQGAQARIKAKAHVQSPGMKGGQARLSLDAIMQFQWKLALGGEEISYAELTALAKLKVPLVRVRGQWVEVDAQEIQRALNFIEGRAARPGTLGEVIRMAIGADGPASDLEVEGVTATGWVAELLEQLQGRSTFKELTQPQELHGTLRPYQQRGFSWLHFLKRWGLGACLADDMGLGKTVQTLALIQHEHSGNGHAPVLLVCPTSVVGNWQKEAARFTPSLPVLVHHGIGRHKGEEFSRQAAGHAIVISSYSLLHRDFEILKQVPWAGVILDEAQNIKNPETKQSRAARGLSSSYRIALTGTPIENHVGDLWSLMEFLNPGFLGIRSEFKKRFYLPIQLYGNHHASDTLKRITSPFILRRLKTDKTIIADLPDKLEMKVFCTLTKEQASLYAAVVDDVDEKLQSAEGIERKGIILATLSKLKQVCNHPAQLLKDGSAIAGRSGKLARLTEMLEETLEVGDRSLVFTQFAEMGELIQRHLREMFGLEVLFLHGGVAKKQRDRMVERFSQKDGPRIFLLSLKAGGTGLNLTSASHVFHFDRWWNPAVENQATDRAFRIGQTKNVQVHKFICAGTLEEKIDEMIERKQSVVGRVVGSGESWLTELSNTQLRNLFALRKEAFAE